MRRFEFSDGKSNKFWQIAVDGCDVTTHWGRIGANGQRKTKTLASPAAAQADADKQIRSKTKKGYAEVAAPGEQEPSAAPAPAPAPAPEPVSEPMTAASESAPVAESGQAVDGVPATADDIPPLPPFQPGLDLVALEDAAEGRNTRLLRGDGRWIARGDGQNPRWTNIRETDATSGRRSMRAAEESPRDFRRPWRNLGYKQVKAAVERGEVPPEMLEHATALAHAEVPTWDTGALTALFVCASERLGWRTMPLGWIDPLANADLARAIEAGIAIQQQLPALQGARLLARLGDWLAAAPEETAAPIRAGLEARYGSAGDELASALILCLRDRALADAFLEAQRPSEALLYVAALASDPVVMTDRVLEWVLASGGSHDISDALEESLLLALAYHGAAADQLVVQLMELRILSDLQWMLEPFATVPISEATARYHGSRKGTREQMDASRTYLELHDELTLRVWGQEEPKAGSLAESVYGSLLLAQPELARRAAVGGRLAAISAVLDGPADAAPPEDWPAVLRDPPWRAPKKKPKKQTFDTVVDGLVVPEIEEVVVRREQLTPSHQMQIELPDHVDWYDLVERASPEAARAIWNAGEAKTPGYVYAEMAEALLHKLGTPGVARFIDTAPSHYREFFSSLLHIRSTRVAVLLAERIDRKSYRPKVIDWMIEHPDCAVGGLMPHALGPQKKARKWAQDALRCLYAASPEAVDGLLAEYPPEARAAAMPFLAVEEEVLPAKIRKPASWLQPALLPPVKLRDGRALGPEAVEALVEIIAFTSFDAPYARLQDVIDACEPTSLEDFVLGLFQLWIGRGAAGKEDYCMMALGHFGTDKSVGVLTPMIRRWPGESAHARAVKGLDVLEAIGTDFALMQLHGISVKLKYKGLKKKAALKVESIAKARGLTAAQLADRLVPDLGLDVDGSRWLDFGPRRFRVGFDEALKPWVEDESGKRRANLPKPGKRDDAEKAGAATEIWKTLKKSARATASSQLARLERAMIDQRRWTQDDLMTFFVRHPLMIHLTRRLVWGTYVDGVLAQTFRVAEDGSFADVEDDECTLEGGEIGIPHRLELSDAAAWSELLGDYEILQPFDQLSRPTFTRKPGEEAVKKLERVKGTVVHWGRVKGLDRRGWQHGVPQDGGGIWEYLKPLGDGREISLSLDPGLVVGAPEFNEDQTLGELLVRPAGTWDDSAAEPWSTVSDVAFSELILDLNWMIEG